MWLGLPRPVPAMPPTRDICQPHLPEAWCPSHKVRPALVPEGPCRQPPRRAPHPTVVGPWHPKEPRAAEGAFTRWPFDLCPEITAFLRLEVVVFRRPL